MCAVQTWEIRKAQPQDRGSIEELCRVSVGPDDYVLDVLDYLITRAVTHIAWKGDVAIGMLAYHRLPDSSGWLSSARTTHEYRRQGVTRSLVESFVSLGKSNGAKVLRLWTGKDNPAGVAVYSRLGFKEVGRFSRMLAPASESPEKMKAELTGYSEALWRQIQDSNLMKISHSYIAHGFGFLKLSRPIVKHFADENTLFTWDRQGAVLAEDMTDGKDMLDAQPLFGDIESVLPRLRGMAKAQGLAYVHSFLPHDPDVLRAAAKNEFVFGDWGREVILFERGI